MPFKSVLATLFLMLGVGCSPKSIPNHQTAIPDEVTQSAEPDVVKEQSDQRVSSVRYGEDHFRMQALITDGTVSSLTEALSFLESQIYGPKASDKSFYTSPEYSGYLDLYVQVSRAIKKGYSEESDLYQKWSLSETRFYDFFLAGCVGATESLCERLEHALLKEASTAQLIIDIADKQEDPLKRLALLGAAFDVSNRRRNPRLESLYLDMGLQVLGAVEEAKIDLQSDKTSLHFVNVLSLINQISWKNPTESTIARFQAIAPWNVEGNSTKLLNELRKKLVPFLPIYSRESVAIKEATRAVVKKRIEGLVAGGRTLSDYPAFENVEIRSLLALDPEVAFLAAELYFQNVSLVAANSYLENIVDKSRFVDQAFNAAKTLVRWDVAHLSIESTERLSQKFSEQDAKTNAFFQETLEWSKTLTPLWNEFHTVRLWTIKSFIEANARHGAASTDASAREFFNAINRNIMKTTVFPNMLAFAFHMAKTEWSAEIRIWWFVFNIDTTIMMDYFLTGQYRYPWFNFTNLKQGAGGWRPQEKTSLFRSELYDSFYYFFATKTHAVYGINADELITLASETLIKKRRSRFDELIEQYRQRYFPDNTAPSVFVKWCEGIKSGEPQKETLLFYETDEYLSPHNRELVSDYTYGVRDVFYADALGIPHNGGDTGLTFIDRYRLELREIDHYLNQYVAIAKRLKQSHPQLAIGNFVESERKLAEFDLFNMKFMGTQKYVADKIGDCLFIAHDETRRRTKQSVFAQHTYNTKIVHPLMKAVKEKEISLTEANDVIQQFHKNQPGIFDKIEASNSGIPYYVVHKVGFMLRNRLFLTEGRVFDHPVTGTVTIEPIVGSHLSIAVPSNLLEDNDNPFLGTKNETETVYSVSYEEEAEEFGQSVLYRTTDPDREESFSKKFTEWDKQDAEKYAEYFRYVTQYEVMMLLMGDYKYLDVTAPGCDVINPSELDDSCILTAKPDMSNVIDVIRQSIFAYVLTEEDKEYFRLKGGQGWTSQDALHHVLKFDPFRPLDYQTRALPFKELAGAFDFTYSLMREDFLGTNFASEWEIEANKATDRPPSYDCVVNRDGCNWGSEKLRAQEFFWARGKKARPIFNYDTAIVRDDYNHVRSEVKKKIGHLQNLENNRFKYLEELKKGHYDADFFDINMNLLDRPSRLIPLSQRFLNNDRVYEKFFVEETEGFFDSEKDWSSYVIQ